MDGQELTPSEKSSQVKKSGKMKHSFSNEWTDEKHNKYLNTIEASFVNQLYHSQHLSTDLMGWLTRTQKKTDAAQSSTNKQQSDQFKVLRRGCWEKLEFEKSTSKVVHDTTEPANQSANPWIQHLVPHAVGDVPYASSDKVEANDIANQSILNSSMKEKAIGGKNLSEHYSVLFQQNCAGSRIGSEVLQLFPEASDQNFVDMEHGLVGEPSKASNTKKRVRGPAHSLHNDQIVPSKPSSSPKNGTRLKDKIAEHSSSMISEQIGTSYCNHKEPDGLGFNNG